MKAKKDYKASAEFLRSAPPRLICRIGTRPGGGAIGTPACLPTSSVAGRCRQ